MLGRNAAQRLRISRLILLRRGFAKLHECSEVEERGVDPRFASDLCRHRSLASMEHRRRRPVSAHASAPNAANRLPMSPISRGIHAGILLAPPLEELNGPLVTLRGAPRA